MSRKKCPAELRPLSHREEKLCQEVLNRGFIDNLNAYLAAGYHPTTDNALVIACNKIAEPKIQRRLNELATLKKIKQTVTRERMTGEYWCLRDLCLTGTIKDTSTAKGCLDSICKVNGLNIEDAAADSEEAERLSLERHKLLDAVARKYIESKEVGNGQKLLGGVEMKDIEIKSSMSAVVIRPDGSRTEISAEQLNSALQDAPGLTNSIESDADVPPEQAQ